MQPDCVSIAYLAIYLSNCLASSNFPHPQSVYQYYMKTFQSFFFFSWHWIIINSRVVFFFVAVFCTGDWRNLGSWNIPMALLIRQSSPHRIPQHQLARSIYFSNFITIIFNIKKLTQYNEHLYTLHLDWSFPFSILGFFLYLYTYTHMHTFKQSCKKIFPNIKIHNKFFRMHLLTKIFVYRAPITL